MTLDQLIAAYSTHCAMIPPCAESQNPCESYASRIKRETSYAIAAFVTFAKSQRLELTVTPIPLTPLEALRALVDSEGKAVHVGKRTWDDALATLKAHDA